jgi:hypothetical protein
LAAEFTKAFDPYVADLMKAAFEDAWSALKASGSVDAAPYRAEWAREVLALRIIDKAHHGERDTAALRDDALAYLAMAKFPRQRSPQASSSSLSISVGLGTGDGGRQFTGQAAAP